MNRTLTLSAVIVFALLATDARAGLVAHYTFDDSGDRYRDVTGNGWDGALGGTGTTFIPSISGEAMSTTANSKMVVDNASTGQGLIGVSLDSFSISFWGNNDTVNNWDNWISFGNDDFFVQNTASDKLAFYNPGVVAGYTSGSLASTSTFGSGLTHVVIAADSSQGNINLYVNGTLEDTENWTVAASSNLGFFTVGGNYLSGLRNIDADIDDVRVFDHAVNAFGVAKLGLGIPVVHQSFDGDVVNDGTHVHTATTNGSPTLTSTPTSPVGSQSMRFDGNDTGDAVVYTGLGGAGISAGAVTIALWANTDIGASPWNDWWSFSTSDGGEMALELNGAGKVSLFNLGGTDVGAGEQLFPNTIDLRDGLWHHLAWTADQAAGTQAFYVDGVLIATGAWTSTQTIDGYAIGSRLSSLGNRDIGAYIDDFIIYDRALSAAEVATLVAPTPAALPAGLLLLGAFAARRRR